MAGWRLASLLVDENGPANIFERIRQLIGLRTGEITGLLPSIFSCIWCMSVYTTLIMYGIWQIEPVVVGVIAAMCVAVIVDEFIKDG